MIIWYAQDEVGYYHLGALSETGYDVGASFALFWHSIEYFAAAGLRWLNLGSSAGVKSNANDGLSRFKQGWSTEARIAYLCGRIFDQIRYSEVVEATGSHSADYFPAYRRGEFE
jgi:lipid II:glycine glycyltransferase (peptidoglycan interpeptide bridge formation enzyme)